MAPPSTTTTTTTTTTLRRSRRLSLYHPSLLPLFSCRSLRHLLQIQSHLTVSSLLSDPFSSSRLLKTSLSLSLPHSLLLFRHLPNPDLFSLNSLLPHLPPPHSLRLLALSPFSPNTFSLTTILTSAARSADLTSGETAHGLSLKYGLIHTTTHICNSLISMYSACGLVSAARQVFDEMPGGDIVTWNSMVDGYVKVGDLGCAREVFDRMPERNVVSWNVMIGGCLKVRRTEMGLGLVRRVMAGEGGVRGDVKTMVGAVTGCGRMGRGREGRSVHGHFVRRFGGEEGNLIFGTALVDMYGKCGRVGDARRVFDGLRGRNLVCWNAMILGYCVHGDPRDGIALFEEMVGEGNVYCYSYCSFSCLKLSI